MAIPLVPIPEAARGPRGVSLAALVLAASLAGCFGEPARVRAEREARILESDPLTDPDKVLAEVNGHAITRGEYYRRVLKKFGTMTMLSGMIKEDLFLQEAARRGIAVKPEEVKAKVDELIAQEAADAGGKDKLEEIYRAQGLRLEDVRRDYARDVEMHLLIGKVTKALRKIDDEAVRGYYQATFAKTRYRVRHIPYSFPLRGLPEVDMARRKIEAREKAERTARRIREGADFAQIARQESEDMTRQTGGDLGYISEDQEMDPVMKEAILKLKPFEVSDPVENNLLGAYHVVQVTEVLPHRSYAECEAQMKDELVSREPDQGEIQDALKALQSVAAIRIFGTEVQPAAAAGAPGREAKG